MTDHIPSSRRTFLGIVAGGTLVAAGAVMASPAQAAGNGPGTRGSGTLATNDTINKLKQSIRIEKLEAKAAGTQPDWAAIASWKDQIRVEQLGARVARLNEIQQRSGADPSNQVLQRKVQAEAATLERKARTLASKLG